MSDNTNTEQLLEEFVEERKNSIDINTKELITTLILSLATLLSAWCGYQSNIWGDIQKEFSSERTLVIQDVVGYSLAAYQIKTAHSNLAVKILESWQSGDEKMYDFFLNRADSVLKNAIVEWIKLDPANNPDAPRSPFQMSSYKLDFDKKSEELTLQSEELQSKTEAANVNSDGYLSLTVLLATVLFFTGMGGTLKSKGSQILSLTISIILFLISIIVLIGLPVAWS